MSIIDCKNLNLSRNGATILDNFSFTISHNEHWAILGPNGCGKTTLLNIITGYLWPMGGTVDVLGDRYGTIDIREKRRQIGLVSSALFERIPRGDSFRDVVLSGQYASLGVWEDPESYDTKRSDELIAFLDCKDIVERKYGALSFGERQRALIGRALMAEPSILILDEPCEGLDIAAREKFLGILDEITERNDITLIMVTHRVEEIPAGITHALIMCDGHALAQGEKYTVVTSEIMSKAMNVSVEIVRRNGRLFGIAT